MKMKYFYGCLMVLFFAMTPAFAQDQPQGADGTVAKMQSKLNLTPDQVNAITPVIQKYSSKREELRQNMQGGTLDAGSMHSQMKQLKDDEAQDLSQVLSSDQMTQWDQMQKKGKHKHHSDGEGGGSSSNVI